MVRKFKGKEYTFFSFPRVVLPKIPSEMDGDSLLCVLTLSIRLTTRDGNGVQWYDEFSVSTRSREKKGYCDCLVRRIIPYSLILIFTELTSYFSFFSSSSIIPVKTILYRFYVWKRWGTSVSEPERVPLTTCRQRRS